MDAIFSAPSRAAELLVHDSGNERSKLKLPFCRTVEQELRSAQDTLRCRNVPSNLFHKPNCVF